MGDATGEEAELLERLGFAALRFIALPLRDIAKDKDHSAKFIFPVADRRSNLLDHAALSQSGR